MMETTKVRSMTGYGKGECFFGDKRIQVEIKTLNSKQLDMSLRMPSIYKEKEFEVRSKINKGVTRGKTDVFITVEGAEGKKSIPINKEVFKSYYNQISELASELDLAQSDICGSILRLPDVLQSQKEDVADQEWAALLGAVDRAIVSLDEFRGQEGRVLMEDLFARIDKIGEFSLAVVPFEQLRVETVKNRIMENLKTLEGVTVDNNRFEQEMIYYIEKLDITEEKVRLKNHLAYFKEIAMQESSGRKLGFIAQEIGREVNTMGSKANNADIQRLVVNMKDELEKIKEQVLNIL